MNLKKIRIILALALSLGSLVSCTNNEDVKKEAENNKNTEQVIEMEQNTEEEIEEEAIPEETNAEENVEVNDENLENVNMANGTYASSLEPGKNGEREADGSWGNVYDILLEGNTLIIKGSLDFYAEDKSDESAELLGNQDNIVKIGNNTRFTSQTQEQSSKGEETTYTPEEFIKFYNENKENLKAIFIEVDNDILTNLAIMY